jgi:transcriptional regulator GlxA family with amidase domain
MLLPIGEAHFQHKALSLILMVIGVVIAESQPWSILERQPRRFTVGMSILRERNEHLAGSPAWSGTATTVARGMRLIEGGFLDEASVTELADRLGVGPRHLLRENA